MSTFPYSQKAKAGKAMITGKDELECSKGKLGPKMPEAKLPSSIGDLTMTPNDGHPPRVGLRDFLKVTRSHGVQGLPNSHPAKAWPPSPLPLVTSSYVHLSTTPCLQHEHIPTPDSPGTIAWSPALGRVEEQQVPAGVCQQLF